MQLSDILEEHSSKNISKKTNIPDESIEYLLNKEFEKLDKAKTIGFISILEREFGADLTPLRNEAYAYYAEQAKSEKGVTLGPPVLEEKKGKSKWFVLFIFLALIYASWYFLTQYDKTHLNTLTPAAEEVPAQNTMDTEEIEDKDLTIINVIKNKWKEITQNAQNENMADSRVHETDREADATTVVQAVEPIDQKAAVTTDLTGTGIAEESVKLPQNDQAAEEKKIISIVPENKLWFGLIDLETKERAHQTISGQYDFTVKKEGILAATSSASFTLVDGEEKRFYNDEKIHYFKIDQSGITEMTKDQYVASGGWSQW
ncbi:MAG: hypothetical protein ABXS92_04045 [Sulfurimonas sp.]